MALLAYVEVRDAWLEHLFAGPTVIDWIQFEVFDGQVGVSYDGEQGNGNAKIYGVGWWHVMQIYPDFLSFKAFGNTTPRFITQQAELVIFSPAITVAAFTAKTKVGVEYNVRFGDLS